MDKKIILSILAIFSFVLVSTLVSAAANSNTSVEIMQTSINEILGWQNTTHGHPYEGYFSQDSTYPAGQSRRQEPIYPFVWLYYNDPTGNFTGNETLLNASLAGIDYLIRITKNDGGWRSSDPDVTDKEQSSETNLATAFTSAAIIDTYALLNASFTQADWGYSERFLDVGGADDFNNSGKGEIIGYLQDLNVTGQNYSRWGAIQTDGAITYRCVNTTEPVYYNVRISSAETNNLANGTVEITYLDNQAGTFEVAFTNTSGAGVYEVISNVAYTNDSNWKTATLNIPPRIRATAADHYTIKLRDEGLCIDSISSGLDRQYEFEKVLNRNANFLYQVQETCPTDPYPFKCAVNTTSNVASVSMYALERYYQVFGNSTWHETALEILSALNQETLDFDGSFTERNDKIRTGGYNNPNNYQLGSSSIYNVVTSQYVAMFYNITSNQTAKDMLDRNWNFTAYMIIKDSANNWNLQGTPSTRKDGTTLLNAGSGFFTGTQINSGMFVNAMIMKNFNTYAERVANIGYDNIEVFDYSASYGNTDTAYGVSGLIHLSRFWSDTPTASTVLPLATNTTFIQNFSNLGLTVINTPNYHVHISHKAASPSGGVIADLFDKNKKLHLFSSQSPYDDDYINISQTGGLGQLELASDLNYTNTWSIFSTPVISTTYPYRLYYEGNFSRYNLTESSEWFKTEYVFYNDYVYAKHKTSDDAILTLWANRHENISSGTFTTDTAYVINNATFFPVSELNYQNSSFDSTWGDVDVYNLTGKIFRYYIGLAANSTSTEFFTYNDSRIALPLRYYDSSDTVKYAAFDIPHPIYNTTTTITVANASISNITVQNANTAGANATVFDTGYINEMNGLIYYLRADTNFNDSTRNYAPLAKNGTIASVVGILNNSFNFSSASQNWIDSNFSTANLNGNFTISYWARGTYSVGTRFFDADGGGGDRFFASMATSNYSIGISAFIATSKVAVDNTWHHFAVVTNGSNAYWYIDGVLDSSTAGLTWSNPNKPIRIGTTENPTGGYLSGNIDEFMILNRPLSQTEVQSLYNQDLVCSDLTDTCTFVVDQMGYNSCSPLTGENWLIDDTDCIVTNQNYALGDYNLTFTNWATLALVNSSIANDRIVINKESSITKYNGANITIQ